MHGMRDTMQKGVRETSEFWRRYLAEARELANELAQKEYPPDWFAGR